MLWSFTAVTVTVSTVDAIEGVALPADLVRVREAYGNFKLATVEFAEACYAAQQNGRSQQAIADAAGCSQRTVSYVLKAFQQSLLSGEPFPDVFTAITNTSRKPGHEGSGGRSTSPSDHEPPSLEPAEPLAGYSMTPEEALTRFIAGQGEMFASMAQIEATSELRESVRRQLHELVERHFA